VAATLRRRPPLALLGGVASMLVALAVVVSLTGGDGAVHHADVPRAPAAAQEQAGSGDPPLDSMADGTIAAPAQPPSAEQRRAQALNAGLATEPAVARPSPSAAIGRADAGAQLVAPVPPTRRPGFAPGTRDRRTERSAASC
jgi:hypothetical protein